MTITYPNGTVLITIVLAHEDCEIRAVAAGFDDVLVYTRVGDTWLSEDWEPVTFGSPGSVVAQLPLAPRTIVSAPRSLQPV